MTLFVNTTQHKSYILYSAEKPNEILVEEYIFTDFLKKLNKLLEFSKAYKNATIQFRSEHIPLIDYLID